MVATTAQPNISTHGPQRGSRLTVAGWQTLLLSVMGLLVLAGALTGAVLLHIALHGLLGLPYLIAAVISVVAAAVVIIAMYFLGRVSRSPTV